jgi:hypothetical protein
MSWLSNLLKKLFGKKDTVWETADYGKPSTEGDDFRKSNEV